MHTQVHIHIRTCISRIHRHAQTQANHCCTCRHTSTRGHMDTHKKALRLFWRRLGILAAAEPGLRQAGLSPTQHSLPRPRPQPARQMLKSGRQLGFLRLLLLSLGLAQGAAGRSTGLAWPSLLPAWLRLHLCKHLFIYLFLITLLSCRHVFYIISASLSLLCSLHSQATYVRLPHQILISAEF